MPNAGRKSEEPPADRDTAAQSLPSTAAMPLGQLGPYQLLAVLGQGGMGTVYRARHLKLDKIVALKVIRATVTAEPGAIERFEREMKALGRLEHPHIVRALDAGETQGTHYLAMEYVEAKSLQQLVRDEGPLDMPRTCELIRQVATALAYAHERGLVHRDLKPANLLMTAAGEVKVLDLGLARLLQDQSGEALTSTGSCVGTPDYMAPEQWQASHDVDHRADLYALGCTLQFLLTGRPPFGDEEHSTAASKMHAHLHETPPLLSAAQAGSFPRVVDLLKSLLAKDPADRPQSANELLERLDSMGLGSSSSQRPATGGARWNAATRRDRRWGSLVSICILLLGAALLCGIGAYLFWPNRPNAGEACLVFGGDNGYVQIDQPMMEFDASYTLEMWLKPESDEEMAVALFFGAERALAVYCGQRAKARAYDANKGETVTLEAETESPPANQWTHYAVTWDGNQLQIFVNGKRCRGKATTQPGNFQTSDISRLGCFREIGQSERCFAGEMDEIRWTLGAKYIPDFTPANRLEAEFDTLALFHCDEGTGALLSDAGPNKRHGTLRNVVWAKNSRRK